MTTNALEIRKPPVTLARLPWFPRRSYFNIADFLGEFVEPLVLFLGMLHTARHPQGLETLVGNLVIAPSRTDE